MHDSYLSCTRLLTTSASHHSLTPDWARRGMLSPPLKVCISPAAVIPTAAGSHIGIFKSGIGLAWKILRQFRAMNRADEFALRRRALSVEMPVPAYICR